MTARQAIATVDVHAAGEPGRVLIGSGLLVRGATMAEKLDYARTHLDRLRRLGISPFESMDTEGAGELVDLDYISCSPFRIPTARLEAGRGFLRRPSS